jgi:hypothetical protein
MKLTQQDQARILGVSTATIRNWKKQKPKLYEIVMKGFAFDEFIEKSDKNLDELKELKKKFELSK